MKKILLSVLIIGFLALGVFALSPAKVKAITLGELEDLKAQVSSLVQEIANLKSLLGAAVLRSVDVSLDSTTTGTLSTDTLISPIDTIREADQFITSTTLTTVSALATSSYLPTYAGTYSPVVAAMQRFANENGCSAGSIDGRYGRMTEAGLNCLYAKAGLVYRYGSWNLQIATNIAAKAAARVVPVVTEVPIVPHVTGITPTTTTRPSLPTHKHLIDYDWKVKRMQPSVFQSTTNNLWRGTISCPGDNGVVLGGGFYVGGDRTFFSNVNVLKNGPINKKIYEVELYFDKLNKRVTPMIWATCAKEELAKGFPTAHF